MSQNTNRPKAEFTDVDRAADPQYYVDCLDFQHTTAFNQAYKQRSYALLDLSSGHRVLDVGCGTGEEARAMARLVGPKGHVTGLDFSQAMVDVAKQRSEGSDLSDLSVSFVQADARAMPFADNTFDRCRADKTFQHLPNPRGALTEMVRVTKPGGTILIVEPDHETRVLTSPYPEITRRFLAFRNGTLQQPGIAHQLYAFFKEYGLIDVYVEPIVQATTDYETIHPVSMLAEGMRVAQQHGVVTAAEADRWIAAFEDDIRHGRFFHAMNYFFTVGRKR